MNIWQKYVRIAFILDMTLWSAAKSWAAHRMIAHGKILARLAAILVILPFFCAKGTKLNRIEKS